MTAIKNQVSTRLFRISAIALTLAAFAQHASSGQFDWPQWQGPDRTAHSKETGLVKQWPKAGPPLAWKANGLGGGDSTPSVAAGRIYGMSHRGADEMVWALSEKDGKGNLGGPNRAGLLAELAAIKRRSELHSDNRWGPALCHGSRGQCGLPSGGRRQGGLATKPEDR